MESCGITIMVYVIVTIYIQFCVLKENSYFCTDKTVASDNWIVSIIKERIMIIT